MSDDDLKPFSIDRAKQGRAKCKKCKNPCEVNNFITFVNKKNQIKINFRKESCV